MGVKAWSVTEGGAKKKLKKKTILHVTSLQVVSGEWDAPAIKKKSKKKTILHVTSLQVVSREWDAPAIHVSSSH